MKLPKEGDFITIQSYKHDGSLQRTWRDTMVLKTTENAIIGVNDHTLVTESDLVVVGWLENWLLFTTKILV